MNEHLVSKIINLCVAYMEVAVRRPGEGREQERKLCKLSNSGAHVYLTRACVSRLDLDHFEHNLIRPDLIRGSLEG